jgi:hypothetical protein
MNFGYTPNTKAPSSKKQSVGPKNTHRWTSQTMIQPIDLDALFDFYPHLTT